nr:hypothetical protein [Dickeya dianthicola]
MIHAYLIHISFWHRRGGHSVVVVVVVVVVFRCGETGGRRMMV